MSLLEMSLSGAVIILVIVVIRALVINRLPKKTFLALWGITLMRLLVPYSVPSAFSVYSLPGKLLSPAKTEPFRASVPAVQPASLLVRGTGIVPSAPTASAASLEKTSLVSVFVAVAVALVAGVTTVFATTGQAAAGKNVNTVQTATNTVMSYTDPAEEITCYSMDEGNTWNSADKFQGVLDMNAKNAKLIANSRWFPDYEQYGLSYDAQQGVLSYNGQLISFFHDETAPGVYTHINFSQGAVGIEVKRNADWEIAGLTERPALTADVTVQEGSLEQTSVIDRTISSTDFYEPTRDELLAEYGKFGISFDISGKMLYKNKPVRWFADFAELEEGALATRYVYRNDEGAEYIHTVRNRIDNGDGSYDPFGPLLEIVPWEIGERDDFGFLFQGSQINETTEAIGDYNVDGITFEERFSKYKDFGITYVETDGASGRGNVYLNGSLVSRFADVAPDGSTFSFSSAETGGMTVHTEYDSRGILIGVQEMFSNAVDLEAESWYFVECM